MVQSAKIVLAIAVASDIMSTDLPGVLVLVLYAVQKLCPFFMKRVDRNGQLLYTKIEFGGGIKEYGHSENSSRNSMRGGGNCMCLCVRRGRSDSNVYLQVAHIETTKIPV